MIASSFVKIYKRTFPNIPLGYYNLLGTMYKTSEDLRESTSGLVHIVL